MKSDFMMRLETLRPSLQEAYFRLAMPLAYRHVDWPDELTVTDIAYRTDGATPHPKHRLSLFLPRVHGRTTVVFVHGGGWTSGDRNYSFAGRDVYANVGRFFASRGFAAAVISYRLMDEVHWQAQLEDVAAAVGWVQNHIGAHGGTSRSVTLAGHSAGAHLAARVALDRGLLAGAGGDPDAVDAVVSVSGAGFDFADEETYRLGADFSYLERRFNRHSDVSEWVPEASAIQFVGSASPSFLFVVGSREPAAYRRQAEIMAARLRRSKNGAKLVIAPGLRHEATALSVSRPGGKVSSAILDFLERIGVPDRTG